VIAAILNWTVVAALVGVGVHYLISTSVMPHHLRILDVAWTDLTPNTRTLLLTLMKGTGMVAICTAVSLAVLTGTTLLLNLLAQEPSSRPLVLREGVWPVRTSKCGGRNCVPRRHREARLVWFVKHPRLNSARRISWSAKGRSNAEC